MADVLTFLAGAGAAGRPILDHDWEATPLGAIGGWPQSLHTVVGLCVNSLDPMAVYWGDDFTLIPNPAWMALHRDRAALLGRPGAEVWGEVWSLIGPQFAAVRTGMHGFSTEDQLIRFDRGDQTRDRYWSYRMIPILAEDGKAGGVLAQSLETTARVLERRHAAFVLALNDAMRRFTTADEVLAAALEVVGRETGAGRVGYAEVDVAADMVVPLGCRTDGTMPPIVDRYPMALLTPALREALVSGVAVAIADTLTDPLTASAALRERHAAHATRAMLVMPVVNEHGAIGGLFVHRDAPRLWEDADLAKLRVASLRIWQEVTRARAQTALADSELRHRHIFEQARDFIFTTDLDQRLTACNPATAAALGVDRDALVGRSIAEFVSEADFARTSAMLARKLADGGTTRYEVEVVAPSGKHMAWDVNSALTLDPAGRPAGIHAVARDVTERRREDARQGLLIHELNHRVKNTLAIVQGLAQQSLRDDAPPAAARAAFEARLAALAAGHDLLTRSQWEGATLGALAAAATAGVAGEDGRVQLDGADVLLPPKMALALVMAFHELATNAAKYGALSNADGVVAIGWRRDGYRLGIDWSERGGPPPPAEPPRAGFGFRMIRRALAADLDGVVELRVDPAGLVCRIDARLPEGTPA